MGMTLWGGGGMVRLMDGRGVIGSYRMERTNGRLTWHVERKGLQPVIVPTLSDARRLLGIG